MEAKAKTMSQLEPRTVKQAMETYETEGTKLGSERGRVTRGATNSTDGD